MSSDSEDSKAHIVYAKKLHDDPALGITVEKKLKKRSKSYEILIENEFKDKQVWKERMKFTDRTDDLVKEEREKRERLEQLKREEEERSLQESRKPNFNSGNEPVPVPIILHFHGGGFVSGNAATHEVYLREWAKETSAIVFSVDYTLAPEAQYPLALEECYYIYRWLLEGNPLGT
jgi:acetyl esterase/lipase